MDMKFLAEMVELDTNSDEKSNYKRCIELIRKTADSAGFRTEVHSAPPEKGKRYPNLIINLDSGKKQTLLIATHYDVVAVGSNWKHQPFKLSVEDGRAYGRGAADDKGGILSAFSALETLRKRGSSKVNVKLLVTCDEEVGGEKGLGYLMNAAKNGLFLLDGDAALLVDAGPRVYIGSSGRVAGRIRAIGMLSELLVTLSGVINYSKNREKVLSKLMSTSGRRIWGRISITMLSLSGGAVEYAEAGVKSNIIPGECRLKLKGKEEKLVVGRQGHAGYPHLAKNAIELSLPLLEDAASVSDGEGQCEFVFDLRTLPEENLDSATSDFERYVRKINPKVELRIEERAGGYVLSESHHFVGMMKRATGEKKAYGELGGTDAQFFVMRQIPPICFGPISDGSNIHGKDEFVKINDLEFVSDTIVRLCENWKYL